MEDKLQATINAALDALIIEVGKSPISQEAVSTLAYTVKLLSQVKYDVSKDEGRVRGAKR